MKCSKFATVQRVRVSHSYLAFQSFPTNQLALYRHFKEIKKNRLADKHPDIHLCTGISDPSLRRDPVRVTIIL